jgi:hypothetical protein
MGSRTQRVVGSFAVPSGTGFWARRLTALKLGFLPAGLLRKFIFLVFI